MNRWLVAALALALATGGGSANALEFEELTFEQLRRFCREKLDSPFNMGFCMAYVMGIAGEIATQRRCDVPVDMLSADGFLNGLMFGSISHTITEADVYDYPKEARLAVNQIVMAKLNCI